MYDIACLLAHHLKVTKFFWTWMCRRLNGNLKWYLIMWNCPKYFLLNLGWNKIIYWNRLELCELWKGNEDVIIRVIYWILSNWLNQIKCHFCNWRNSIVCFITSFHGYWLAPQHMGVHSSVGRALQWQCHGLKSQWGQILFFFVFG